MLLFIIILFTLLIFITSRRKQSIFTVSCDSNTDMLCRMYNHKDISTTCDALCKLKDDKSSFTNEYSKKNGIYSCECVNDIIDKNVEHLSNIKDIVPILPQQIPTDILYSDRNYVEQQNESRLKKLIFG